MKKTMARAQDKEEIVRRLRTIRADSAATMGPHVGASDDLSFERLVSRRHRTTSTSAPRRACCNHRHQVDRALCATQVAARRSDETGSRSGSRRDQAVALRRRRDATRDARRADHDAERLLRTDASHLWQYVRHRLDALGLPAHGSSPASVRALTGPASAGPTSGTCLSTISSQRALRSAKPAAASPRSASSPICFVASRQRRSTSRSGFSPASRVRAASGSAAHDLEREGRPRGGHAVAWPA